jgi:hypothetical protein
MTSDDTEPHARVFLLACSGRVGAVARREPRRQRQRRHPAQHISRRPRTSRSLIDNHFRERVVLLSSLCVVRSSRD